MGQACLTQLWDPGKLGWLEGWSTGGVCVGLAGTKIQEVKARDPARSVGL